MSVRWHVVAWIGLVAGLTVWMWPLDPAVSLMDLTEMTGLSGTGPGNTLDALFSALVSDGPLEGTALLRSWVGGVLIGGTVATEIVLRRNRQRRNQLPPAPSEAQFGYSE